MCVCVCGVSSPVSVAPEVKPQLKDASVIDALEALPMGVLPFSVDDLEGEVLVGRACMETDDAQVLRLGASFDEVTWRLRLVDQVRIEDVELVALHNLRRRIVVVLYQKLCCSDDDVSLSLSLCFHVWCNV